MALETDISSASESYDLSWVYDLVGNRVSQIKQFSGNTQTTTYQYDANDRLLHSSRVGGGPSESIVYGYNKTQQTSETTTTAITTTQAFAYDLQGRLASVTSTKSNDSTITRTGYKYDSTGTRIGSAQSTATTQQPTNFILQSTLEYLTDSQNPTGYSQVLEETEFRPSDQGVKAVKKTIYTVGHDQISQSVLNWVDGTPAGVWEASTQYFGTDGHGSVRVLYDMTAAIVRNQPFVIQLYNFDAYGNLLGWTNVKPLTSYLYSGESFDFNIGQQYLRARFYDATTGRFTGLDPFYGNSSDPQSFHKYAYVHGDPIQGIDPTGEFLGAVIGIGISMMVPGPGDFIRGGLEALVKAYVSNLEWDVEWALDMSLPDSWGSRLDDSWVYSALGQGLHDAFDINTPFGTFNPLDPFGGGSDASARSMRGPSGGSSSVFFRGAHRAMHSLTETIEYGKYAGAALKKMSARVSFYFHSKLGQFIVKFPERVKAEKVKINATTPPGGKFWDQLNDIEKSVLSRADIAKATEELKRRNGGRLPTGVDEVAGNGGLPNGRLRVNGVTHTWHKTHKKGEMELIPTDLHEQSIAKVGPHIGQALWWSRL